MLWMPRPIPSRACPALPVTYLRRKKLRLWALANRAKTLLKLPPNGFTPTKPKSATSTSLSKTVLGKLTLFNQCSSRKSSFRFLLQPRPRQKRLKVRNTNRNRIPIRVSDRNRNRQEFSNLYGEGGLVVREGDGRRSIGGRFC